MPLAVEVEQLSKRFGAARALDGVSWSAEAGSAVALLGPNGAGKTTLLRLCATLLRPSDGRVRLFGMDAAEHGTALRRRLAVLGHESFLYPDLSPRENLRFYARLFRVAGADAQIEALIQRLGLAGWSHRPVRTLSRGLLQRCALARVLLHRPELLLLDEPFTGLDLAARDLLCDVLREAHTRGATVLMSTHEIALGLGLCTHALVLSDGRVAWQGAVAATDRAHVEAAVRELTPRAAGVA
jgi:heme exporter protein A